MNTPLVLRDVHPGNAPPWWPPAPGWWMVLALLLLIAGMGRGGPRAGAAAARDHCLFDAAVARADTPSQQVAAMSDWLRRLPGPHPGSTPWKATTGLRVLDDGMPQPVFSAGAGALLREGGYRADVGVEEADACARSSRQRYMLWMQPK